MNDKTNNFKTGLSFSSSFSSLGNKLENGFDDILSRMKAACNADSDKKLSESIGVQYSAIAAARKRDAIPAGWYLTVADQYGASMDWLRTGEGNMMRITQQVGRSSRSGMDTADNAIIYNGKNTLECFDCELMLIPLMEARLSAGNGSFETSADSDRRYAFRTDFLRRKGNASAMVLMRVAGDSMEPDVKDNDVVLIDTANITPLPGRLYAVAVQDMVYLKMVNAAPDKLILSSANTAYAPLEIDARGDLKSGIRIIGKAIWVGRELD